MAVIAVPAKFPIRMPRSRALLEPASRTFAAALVRAPGRRAPGAAGLVWLGFVVRVLVLFTEAQSSPDATDCRHWRSATSATETLPGSPEP